MINLVLIHGWGCDSRTWQPVLESLQARASITLIDLPGFGVSAPLPEFLLDSVLDKIAVQLPHNPIVMGWSLGGMLAVQLAARFPQKISGVISLAANLKFVATADYPSAMARAVNRHFNNSFAQDPQASLKVFSGLLAQGDEHERALLKQLRRAETGEITHNWLQALELLAQLDNRAAFAQLTVPGLHLLAEQDALVPVSAANAMKELNPQQQIIELKNTAHALHWSRPQTVVDAVTGFLMLQAVHANTSEETQGESSFLRTQESMDTRVRGYDEDDRLNDEDDRLNDEDEQLNESPGVLDKKKIAQSFGRAAATYDSVAQLQRDVGTELLLTLPVDLPEHARILDLGSGTGFFATQLAQRYSQAQVIGVDLAEGMLHFARNSVPEEIHWLCGDAENLPLADKSIDVIFSSLAIQWCNNLPQLMVELQRVLKPGGRVYIATLGPTTLHELKAAWQAVDNYVHVNRFQPVAELTLALEQSGLILEQLQVQERVLYFARVTDLTRELKALGAHNINSGKPEGLTSRARLLAFKNAYEHFRTAQGLPASYEVIYLTAIQSSAGKSHG